MVYGKELEADEDKKLTHISNAIVEETPPDAVVLTEAWHDNSQEPSKKPSKVKLLVAKYVRYKALGYTNEVIAKHLGVSTGHLKNYVSIANKNGWLKYFDPFEQLEKRLIPKAVDNLEYFLDKKDRTVTIETAKGTGLFKSHQAVKVEGQAAPTVIAIRFENPTGDDIRTNVIEGNVVGRPRQLNGEDHVIQVRETEAVPVGETPGTRQEMDQEVREQAVGGSEEGQT